MLKIRKALISVWDKHGVIELAKRLREFNIEIVSTGKTASLLRKSGVTVTDVSSLTGFPEILSGRVKTLHPKVFGAILANKKHPLHLEEIKSLEISPIDMVVVNLYPFKKMSAEKINFDQLMEYIDIGGPALLRAGAKNFKNIACLSSPLQYKHLITELKANHGCVRENILKGLACEVFRVTKEYDTCIYSYLTQKELMIWDLEKSRKLRYGENPHQKAALFRVVGKPYLEFLQIQGKQISFNNLLDIDTALALVKGFQEPAATVIKHTSPCGLAVDKNITKAYLKAYRTDPISSFGGIIGLNRKVDKKTAQEVLKSGFRECVIAPAFSKEAMRIFSNKKNMRIIETDFTGKDELMDIKKTSFGYLIQEPDGMMIDKRSLKVVTAKKPTTREIKDLLFAWKVVKYAKSNAVVIARHLATLGVGMGQPARVDAVQIAVKKSSKSLKGAVIASDAFFPKEDSIKLLKKHEISAVVQPGGSIMDEKLITLCNKYRIAMVFTGIRHFRH